jgi:hypothetical protein
MQVIRTVTHIMKHGEIERNRLEAAKEILKRAPRAQEIPPKEALASEEIEEPQTDKTHAPESRLRAQERRILEIIRALGYDPKNLPKNKSGRPGVKAAVRKAAGKALFQSGKVFDLAWERLRNDGSILDQ